jgi:chaperonin cofactor prefoldin
MAGTPKKIGGLRLRAVRTRQRELLQYIDELHERASTLETELESASRDQRAAQRAFDEAMRARFSPFMSQRDELLAEQGHVEAAAREQRRLLTMHRSRERRGQELGGLRQQLAEVLRSQADAAATNTERGDVINELERRFGAILAEFHFPKLADAQLDQRYAPSVRGVRYDQLRSAGAMTLSSLAWYLSVFETSIEDDGASGPADDRQPTEEPRAGKRPTG